MHLTKPNMYLTDPKCPSHIQNALPKCKNLPQKSKNAIQWGKNANHRPKNKTVPNKLQICDFGSVRIH
jgi:hypothetical protein